jgi:hypothetical protein
MYNDVYKSTLHKDTIIIMSNGNPYMPLVMFQSVTTPLAARNTMRTYYFQGPYIIAQGLFETSLDVTHSFCCMCLLWY